MRSWFWQIQSELALSVGRIASVVVFLGGIFAISSASLAADNSAAARFHADIEPLLVKHCYECHGDGMKKGGVAFDEFKSDQELLGKTELWWKVLKNVRAGIMPPAKKPRPSEEEKLKLASWIKDGAFGIDATNPDPGRVTIRRLNRVEYKNSIRDLMGFDFKVDDEFPPDDSGYGFDNIGDVLSISPLLLEKYMQAAETIVAGAVPTVWRVPAEMNFAGSSFKSDKDGVAGDKLSFYKEAKIARSFKVDQGGDYRITVELSIGGEFDFDPGRCRLIFKLDDRELKQEEFGWQNGKRFHFNINEQWQPGEKTLSFELVPLTPVEKKKNSLDLRIANVKVLGPLAPEKWVRPKNFDRFFGKDDPKDLEKRREYAHEIFQRFASKAFRRPVDQTTVARLTSMAEGVYSQPGKRFEEGVAEAMVAVLASPRFLFRVEANTPSEPGARSSPIDEYSLASRLSYFLWASMPDDELIRLAEKNELRKNLDKEVKRLLADSRSQGFVESFTGQWLQSRDVDGINVDARIVLVRDAGQEREMKKAIEEFRARLAAQEKNPDKPTDKPPPKVAAAPAAKTEKDNTNTPKPADAKPDPKPDTKTPVNQAQAAGDKQPAQQPAQQQANRRPNRPKFFDPPAFELDDATRKAMRAETQMSFAYIMHENRSVNELLDADYTFLNEKLAKLYAIPDVKGPQMRRVTLPKDSPRGGVLTQGSMLVVTSNPTRTSPVKRGLFILDNILGLPPPPPPPDIPQLEASESHFKDRDPTLREVLAIHREKPLCSSCHSRMDALGLALENFNALGRWRVKERGQAIDSAGTLITGESFKDVRELKKILVERHREDFYRCLTEKMLTYALGRGLEYYDVEAVDRIVDRLEKEQGHFSALLMGVIESSPFQNRRNTSPAEQQPRAAVTTESRVERSSSSSTASIKP